MASSKVQIANQALIQLGVDPILTLDDATKPARTMKAIFDPIKEQLLRLHFWNCVTKRYSAAADVDAPVYEFTRQFTLPTDFLLVVSLENKNAQYVVENGKILTNESSPLKFKYIRKTDDMNDLDSMCRHALAMRLAVTTGFRLTGSRAVVSDAMVLYQTAISEARYYDSIETSIQTVEADHFLDAHVGGVDDDLDFTRDFVF